MYIINDDDSYCWFCGRRFVRGDRVIKIDVIMNDVLYVADVCDEKCQMAAMEYMKREKEMRPYYDFSNAEKGRFIK